MDIWLIVRDGITLLRCGEVLYGYTLRAVQSSHICGGGSVSLMGSLLFAASIGYLVAEWRMKTKVAAKAK